MALSVQLSPTVERTRDQLVDKTGVPAVEVVQSILARHIPYAPKTATTNSDSQRQFLSASG